MGNVKSANFWRGFEGSCVEVLLEGKNLPFDIWAGAIDTDTAKFSSSELEQIVSMLSCEKEAMQKQHNFPPIYDEMLSDLIKVQRERYGVKKLKGKTNRGGITSKIDEDALYTLCELYDEEEGPYPEHPYEGEAVYRFFRKLSAEGTKMKPGFANYIVGNATSGSLREMFYNYFIAHLGKLPEDDRDCEEEIIKGLARFSFEQKEEVEEK